MKLSTYPSPRLKPPSNSCSLSATSQSGIRQPSQLVTTHNIAVLMRTLCTFQVMVSCLRRGLHLSESHAAPLLV